MTAGDKDLVVKLGLVDSGLPETLDLLRGPSCRFREDETGEVHCEPVGPDRLGHGSRVAEILHHHAPGTLFYNAQVFDDRGVTTAATVAAALDWLVSQKVDMINLSLGVREDRAILRDACVRAVEAKIIVIASAPAQGPGVYPSSYPGIIRATGDARCDTDEISWLDNVQADFGACPRAIGQDRDAPPRAGGASLGTAHLSGLVAAWLQDGGECHDVQEALATRASYRHRERRTGQEG